MNIELLFPSAVLSVTHPEFLYNARIVVNEYLEKVQPNEWNVCQSESMFDDRLSELLSLIAKESFKMLSEQGYDMPNYMTRVSEFWGQEFFKGGQHIEHIHSNGAQITGFYFVDVPDNSSYPAFFDPRQGKKQINLRQKKVDEVSYASEQIFLKVSPGDLMLFNSWLPHGFTKHESNEPFRFIHFNVVVDQANVCHVEVV
jgi:uncharacterized protein (TIGR02466 family)